MQCPVCRAGLAHRACSTCELYWLTPEVGLYRKDNTHGVYIHDNKEKKDVHVQTTRPEEGCRSKGSGSSPLLPQPDGEGQPPR